ncbi:SCO2524 family protein [Yinghuangia sp. ASG 101]|uniref:SCO2524 family protein n=1 Tax=Yinghuangia sp. ASG 101 TaxID=2896848 RepID=UPI001E5584EE|nr:SCO2524 family protein [Yinghuangia sp. ASG 101]UGQ10815.1 SCO2524 family protein [Yinghuangia sp. ASG 101]
MTTLPRRRLLDIWKALAARCAARSTGTAAPWPSGDSMRDAEQLVCLLYPAMRMPGLGFADPDTTGQDVLDALAPLGDHQGIPRTVVEICLEYLEGYTGADGGPVFAAPGQLRALNAGEEPSAAQRRIETVESFSISVTLCLSMLAFAHACERRVRAPGTRDRLDTLRRAASARLTHAMTALRESFVAQAFPQDSDAGRTLVTTVFRDAAPDSRRLHTLLRELRPIRLGLRGLDLPAPTRAQLGDENRLFACGWAWGRAEPPHADTGHAADPHPSLYFTVAAMDGIVDLFSARETLLPGLLHDGQLTLAQQLLVRWELTQRYWSILARAGGDWPLRDIPWRGPDWDESDYSTLHVASILIHNFMRQGDPDDLPLGHELRPVVAVLEELAARAKITRRALPDDPAVALHAPGMTAPLHGAERLGPPVGWTVDDFTPVVLKRALQVAALARTMDHRDAMLALAGELTDHLWKRRLDSGTAAGLWDAPERVYPGAPVPPTAPSWHMTERAVETLVVAAAGIAAELVPAPGLVDTAADMLREAEHLLAREMLTRTMHAPSVDSELHLIGVVLRRSRSQADRHPAVAIALASDALRRLDALASAREQAARGMI